MRLSPVDLVIVEGFKREAHPKVEIHRAANGKPWLFPDIPDVRALLSDVAAPGFGGPRADLDAIETAADLLLAAADPRDAVLDLLRRTEPVELARQPRKAS